MMSTELSIELNREITTETELIQAFKDLGLIEDNVPINNIKELILLMVEELNKTESSNITYEEFLEMGITGFLETGSRYIRHNNRK